VSDICILKWINDQFNSYGGMGTLWFISVLDKNQLKLLVQMITDTNMFIWSQISAWNDENMFFEIFWWYGYIMTFSKIVHHFWNVQQAFLKSRHNKLSNKICCASVALGLIKLLKYGSFGCLGPPLNNMVAILVVDKSTFSSACATRWTLTPSGGGSNY
jgi:hypothetical protein